MTPAEFRDIVTAWGGPEKFAKLIHAQPRVVYAYLSGERRIRPTLAFLFRQLDQHNKQHVIAASAAEQGGQQDAE